ncbi:hypothetical protein Tcan_06131 [Toxocara canis]|uniref:Uncharacterized protein n=1 Tax=Toxocara canis TaxID=6265 RepID=A0A0B2V6F7_TOXCA|nr:hypothetical protein Tcan_06131 [Toxocara canis]
MSGKGAQDSAEKKRCITVLQKLMTLPNVSLSLFLTHEFREYTAVLNPRFTLPASGGGVCSLSDGPLQVIKEKIVREVEDLLEEHRSLLTFGAESASRIRSLLQRSLT